MANLEIRHERSNGDPAYIRFYLIDHDKEVWIERAYGECVCIDPGLVDAYETTTARDGWKFIHRCKRNYIKAQ